MVTRKKTGRRRRAVTRSGRKRTAVGVRGAGQQDGQGPNLLRLLRADVLTARGARTLSAAILNWIEQLAGREVDTLISVRRRLGRKPNCWLI
jgi:hypothetical protein